MLNKSLIVICAVFLISMFSVPAFAGSSADAGASAVLQQDNHSIVKAMEARPYAGPVPIPGQPGWFTTPTPDGSFQSLRAILQYGDVFTEGALENMAKGKVAVRYMVTNDKNEVARAKFADNLKRKIKILIVKPDAKFIAYANGNAKNGKTDSVQVMAAIALKALRDGANVVAFTAEGAHRKVQAFGWGIGVSGTTASENSMVTPGLGISGGNSGPEDWPWLQGAAFVDPKLVVASSVKVGQTGNHRFVKKAETKVIRIAAKPVMEPVVMKDVFIPSTGNIAGQ